MLSRRPEIIAKKEGMEHFVYITGRVTDSTFKLFKQVIFDLELRTEFCHVVSVCTERVPSTKERSLKGMGVGILVVRQDAETFQLVRPRLVAFREPSSYDRVPRQIRARVREALRKIREDDVCVGVLDLAQALEYQLSQLGFTGTLGQKIGQAQRADRLSTIATKAAQRVNWPRINRAHPGGHATRRSGIVARVQEIVEDCLAVMFALG